MNGPGHYPLPHPLLASVMHFIPLQVHYQLQTRGCSPLAQKPKALPQSNIFSFFKES